MSEVWRRVYVSVGAGDDVAGVAIPQHVYEEAVERQRVLEEYCTGDWDGRYDYPLDPFAGEPRYQRVLRVTSDGLELGEYSPDGYMSVRILPDRLEEAETTAVFESMVAHYALQTYEEFDEDEIDMLTPADVAEVVRDEDQTVWDRVAEEYDE